MLFYVSVADLGYSYMLPQKKYTANQLENVTEGWSNMLQHKSDTVINIGNSEMPPKQTPKVKRPVNRMSPTVMTPPIESNIGT